MGLATLNVWIHNKTDPCRIDDGPWFVHVTYCNGTPVEWCGHTYSAEPANCGHGEIQLPPGCYVVFAVQVLFLPPIIRFTLTDHAIAIVGCGEHACVNLYTPADRQPPGSAALRALLLAETQGLSREKVDKFVAASDALLEGIPKTSRDEALERLLEELAERFKNNPPERSGSTR
jgi:hypothetical protein